MLFVCEQFCDYFLLTKNIFSFSLFVRSHMSRLRQKQPLSDHNYTWQLGRLILGFYLNGLYPTRSTLDWVDFGLGHSGLS